MPAPQVDNISAPGTSTALNLAASIKQVRYTFTGTFAGAVGVVQVSNDGTNYVNLLGIREDTGSGFTGTIGSASFSILVNTSGWTYCRLNVSALASGTLVVRADQGAYSLPQGVQPISLAFASSVVTSNSATALAAGANGATNPAFNVDASASSAATGWNHVAAAAAGGAALAVISSGTNESGTVDAKGTGSLKLNSIGGTGFVQLGGAASGANATGLKVTPNAAASGLAVAVVSSGSNENLTIDAKGSGTISLNVTGTGNITLGRAATGVSLAVTAGLTSSGATGAGIGYATGAGGAVTQGTSRSTAVTLNTLSGAITLVSAAGSATPFSFTLTNSTIAATDVVTISQKSGTDKYTTQVVTGVAAGSCQITLANASGTTTEQPVFNFNVFKGVAS